MSLAGKFTDLLSDGLGSQPLGHIQVGSVSTHAPSDAIIVPDAHLLFTGDFKRSGVDLILSAQDRELVLHDYFKGEKRAALASPDGAHLTGDIVNALSGHTQFAQADGSASVAPQVIGSVTKLTGNATAIRNGVSIVLNQGDNVHKGDVVQSGSDSTLGITFIDGTVFGLASNAKMVLNEMIYDPNGSDNKSLLSLVQGTISFVAGATAKKGDMKVDTPVATMGIRGTAVLVEIDFEVPGQGAAPPAKFQVLVEPDGTTGSYILFDKTTLTPIATVNRAGTQTIINGQGGVSFQSSVQLSPDAQKIITDVFSLKFSDLNNPNTKLTTNFTDSIVPETLFAKLASNDFVPVTLQLLNIPNGPAPTPDPGPTDKSAHIPGPPLAKAFGGAFAERTDVTGSAAADSASNVVNYVDINAGDIPSVSVKFSSFAYQNAQQADVSAMLTAEQLAAIQAVEVPVAVVQDPNAKNTGSATWTYTVADGAFDFLAAGETLTLTYMARVDNNFAPNNESTFTPFTITITGTNDKPTIASSGGEITERIGTGNTAIDTVTGTVVFTDPDLTDRPVVSADISATDPFRYYDADGNDITSTLTAEQLAAILAVEVPMTVVQAAGNSHDGSATWTYSIADSAFDFIADGETLTLNYVAQVDDGHGGVISTPITVSIHGADVVVIGTNDVPTIDVTSDAFPELSNVSQPNPTGSTDPDTASGTISFTDTDLTDRPVASAAFTSYAYQNASHIDVTLSLTATQIAAIAAVDVSLTVEPAAGNTNNGSASWAYSVPDSAFDFLADGEILTLTYTATVNDGHGGIVTKPFTIEITGSNDTAVVTSGTQTGTITERAGTHDSSDLDTDDGTIQFTDVDLTDTHAVTIKGVDASGVETGLANGAVQLTWLSLGSLTDSTNGVTGSRNWTFSAEDHYFDYLADGEAVTLTYTVEIDDHHGGITSQDIAVTINGSNDAPTIAAIAQQDLTEPTDTAAVNAVIAVSFTDLDLTDVDHVAAITDVVATGTTTGLALDDAALMALVTAGEVTKNSGSSSGSVDLSFSAASTAFDYLADGEVLTLTYTVSIDDGDGGVTPKTFVVTVTGTNDAPVVAPVDVTSAVTELVAPVGDLTDSGTIALADVDLTDTHSIAPTITASAGALGSLTASVSPDTVNGVGGVINWNYSVAASDVEYLAKNETRVEHFTITLDDGNGGTVDRTIDVTITGTNDAPVIDTIAQQDLIEQTDNSALTTTIAVTFADVDLADVGHTASITGITKTGATAGLALTDAQLMALVTPQTVTKASASSVGSVDLDFSAASTVFDYLATDEILTLTYTVAIDDHDGGVTSKTFVVTVTGTNDAPVITSNGGAATAAISVAENSTAVTTVQADDVDGPSTSYSILTGPDSPDHAKFVIDQDTGALSFAAAPDYETPASAEGNNFYTVQVQAADGAGGFDVQTIAVTVTNVEEPPVAVDDDSIAADEDSALTIAASTLLANDIDDDGDSLTVVSVSGTSANGATVTLSGTDITYDPTQVAALQALAAGDTTTDTFDYTVSDGHGGTDTATVTLTVAGVNDAPVVQGGVSTKEASLANNNGVAVSDGLFFFGNDKLTVSDVDDNAQFGIAIIGVNNGGAIEGWEYQTSGGDWIKIELDQGEALLLSATDKVRFSGSGNGSTEQLTFVAWDGTDGSTSGSIITIPQLTGGTTAFSSGVYSVGAKNDAPVINTAQFSVTENQDGTTTVSGLLVVDSDAGTGEVYTVEATTESTESDVTPPAVSGDLAEVAAALSTGGVTYNPGSSQPATDRVTLKVTDAFGATDIVNFVFNQAGQGPVTLEGTSGKDVVFSTGYDDTLTGNAGADQFIFTPEGGSSADTITDFAVGEDHIDLRAFSAFVDSDNIGSWLANPAHVSQVASDTVITLDNNDTITLKNVASLQASDFIVSPHA